MGKWLIISIFPIILFGSSHQRGEKEHFIYVVSISWHTGIIVPGYAFPDSIWPDGHNLSRYDYLEIGWGDRDFFQHPGFNPWYAIKATFWPTSSALHILPLHGNYLARNYDTKLVRLAISLEELEDLSGFIVSHLKLDDQGKVILLKKGWPYMHSRFFAGSKKYYFPKNSNVRAAQGLNEPCFTYTPIFSSYVTSN